MAQFAFKFFICGGNERHHEAVLAFHQLCDNYIRGDYSVDVIDVSLEPQAAEAERVLAAPAVVRVSPAPVLRIVGHVVSDDKQALVKLGALLSDE